jgi:hypothetical protein
VNWEETLGGNVFQELSHAAVGSRNAGYECRKSDNAAKIFHTSRFDRTFGGGGRPAVRGTQGTGTPNLREKDSPDFLPAFRLTASLLA